jgi:hypothetical protein
MSEINFERTLVKKNNKGFSSDFTELVNLVEDQNDALESPFTLADFFQLFYDFLEQIPLEGNPYSLRVMLDVISEKLGIFPQEETDISALLEEITSLRNQLSDSNRVLENALESDFINTDILEDSITDTQNAIEASNKLNNLTS